MKGTPDNTVILHWDECRRSWAKLSWRDQRARGTDPELGFMNVNAFATSVLSVLTVGRLA